MANDQTHTLNDGNAKEMAEIYKLLGDESRLYALNILNHNGEMHVTAMEEQFGRERFIISQPALSHHLALLRLAGLVEASRDGKHNYYSITEKGKKGLQNAFGILQEFSEAGAESPALHELPINGRHEGNGRTIQSQAAITADEPSARGDSTTNEKNTAHDRGVSGANHKSKRIVYIGGERLDGEEEAAIGEQPLDRNTVLGDMQAHLKYYPHAPVSLPIAADAYVVDIRYMDLEERDMNLRALSERASGKPIIVIRSHEQGYGQSKSEWIDGLLDGTAGIRSHEKEEQLESSQDCHVKSILNADDPDDISALPGKIDQLLNEQVAPVKPSRKSYRR